MEQDQSQKQILKGKIDAYKVMNIDEPQINCTQEEFSLLLKNTVEYCVSQSCKAIWLKLTSRQMYLSQITIDQGFDMHHAEKEYLMLKKWLLPNKLDNLPQYTTHMIGVGAVVINDKNQVLLVKEKNGYRAGTWNIPGGRVDKNESIIEGAIRELKEETGIISEYSDIILTREVLNTLFGKPDIYFAFLLKPKNLDVKIQQDEISDYKWVDIQDLKHILESKPEDFQIIIPTQRAVLRTISEFKQKGKQFYEDKIFNASFNNYLNRPYNIFKPNL